MIQANGAAINNNNTFGTEYKFYWHKLCKSFYESLLFYVDLELEVISLSKVFFENKKGRL